MITHALLLPAPPLAPAVSRVLAALRDRADQDGFIRIGHAELAEICGTQQGNISKYIKKLVVTGAIKRHRRDYKGRYGPTSLTDCYEL